MLSKKKIMAFAGISMAAGVILSSIGWLMGGRPGFYVDASGVHSNYEAGQSGAYIMEKTKIDAFSSANISMYYGDIYIVPSDGYYMEYRVSRGQKEPAYHIKDKTLTFDEAAPAMGAVHFFSIGPTIPYSDSDYYVKLYVPEEQYFELLKIRNESGDVELAGIKAGTLDMQLDYGDLNIGSAEAESFKAVLSSGTLKAGKIDSKSLDISDEYGDIICEEINAKQGNIQLDSGLFKAGSSQLDTVNIISVYGDVDLKSLTSQNMTVKMESGDLDIRSAALGKFEAESDYGSISIGIKGGIDKYSFDIGTEYGSIDIPGYDGTDSDVQRFISKSSKEKNIKIYCSSGDIEIREAK